jgi:hypothetical protein
MVVTAAIVPVAWAARWWGPTASGRGSCLLRVAREGRERVIELRRLTGGSYTGN